MADVTLAGIKACVFDAYGTLFDYASAAAGTILFVSSNAWDAYAASAFGMRVAWCNRYAQQPERLPGQPDREIRTLAALPALLGA